MYCEYVLSYINKSMYTHYNILKMIFQAWTLIKGAIKLGSYLGSVAPAPSIV